MATRTTEHLFMNRTILRPMGAAFGARTTAWGQAELDARDGIGVAVLSAYKGVFAGPCGRPAVIGREVPTV